jgi:hypothetical protein
MAILIIRDVGFVIVKALKERAGNNGARISASASLRKLRLPESQAAGDD